MDSVYFLPARVTVTGFASCFTKPSFSSHLAIIRAYLSEEPSQSVFILFFSLASFEEAKDRTSTV